MEARAVGSDTMLARIVRMVAEAQRSRAPIQAVADRVSGWFVPLVVLISIATFITWSLVGPEPRMGHALLNAIAVLVIACPCALGLATPMSIMVGTGRGAQAGVLVKNAEALQGLEKVDTLVIDKTGTLTEGKPKLIAVETVSAVGRTTCSRLPRPSKANPNIRSRTQSSLPPKNEDCSSAQSRTLPRKPGWVSAPGWAAARS
jgi:Cu+-exporting ATPase